MTGMIARAMTAAAPRITMARGLGVVGSAAGAGARRLLSSRSAFALGLADDRGGPPSNPFAVAPGCLLPGLPASEFQERRRRLFDVLPNDSALVVNAADVKYMTHDIPFEFHQNANFLYLTGVEEPGAHAVMVKRGFECSFALFVLPRDRHSEQWDGARIGLEAARERYGADESFQVTDLERGLAQVLKGLERVFVLAPDGGRFPASFVNASKPFHDKFISGDILVEQLRVIKSERELDRMRVAADIGCQGFIDMMSRTRPGMTERALAAEFEGSCKRNGALGNAFPNVVGAGSNAAVVHYLAKRDVLRANELVLVDSGCEVAGGYVSDITRTWPVGGPLPAGHTQLYEFVLDVQKKCISYLQQQIETKQPVSLDNVHDYSVALMMDSMKEFGIMKKSANAARFSRNALVEFQKYNPTHIGHYLGMDTHDTPHVTRGAPLVPGMVVTIEPGIYLPKNDMDLPEEFRGIGIRIEDDVVITETGVEVLTSKVPKELKEMEGLRNA